jgi:hypothetical protein
MPIRPHVTREPPHSNQIPDLSAPPVLRIVLYALDLAASAFAMSDCSAVLRRGLCRRSRLAEDDPWQTHHHSVAPVSALSASRLHCRISAMRPSPARIALLQHTIYMRRSHGIHPAGSSLGRHNNGAHNVQTLSHAFVRLLM